MKSKAAQTSKARQSLRCKLHAHCKTSNDLSHLCFFSHKGSANTHTVPCRFSFCTFRFFLHFPSLIVSFFLEAFVPFLDEAASSSSSIKVINTMEYMQLIFRYFLILCIYTNSTDLSLLNWFRLPMVQTTGHPNIVPGQLSFLPVTLPQKCQFCLRLFKCKYANMSLPVAAILAL